MTFIFRSWGFSGNCLTISVDKGEIYQIKREDYNGQCIAIMNLRSYRPVFNAALKASFEANEIRFYEMCAELNKSGESFKIVKKYLEERLIKLKKELKTIVDLIDN